MLREASTIINRELIERYRNYPLTKSNLRWHIETTISALKVIKESINIAKEDNDKLADNIIYSLILRLREAYIVRCLIQNKIANNYELKNILKNVSGTLNSYHAYLRSKKSIKSKKATTIKEAESLYNYVSSEIEEQRAWIKRKG